MSLRFRRILHFAGFCSVLLGLLCIVISFWMASFLHHDSGFLLAVEGFMASIFFVLVGLLIKLHAVLSGKLAPPRPAGDGKPLARLVDQVEGANTAAYRFWWVAGFLSLLAMACFVALLLMRAGYGQEYVWMLRGRLAFGSKYVTRHLFASGCFMVNLLLLLAQQCLLSSLQLRLGTMYGDGRRSQPGTFTVITGSPSA